MENQKTVWCPYTNSDLDIFQTTPEHIIPLSLGGCNEFTIPVEKVFNSKVGSQIDGKYGNDFLVAIRRNREDARGHSKKRPIPIVKKGMDHSEEKIVQINMDNKNEHIELFDPISRQTYPAKPGQQLGMSFQMDADIHLQLAAKIALSAGYYVYGDWFKNNVRHEDLRLIMKGPSKLSDEEIKTVKTKNYHFLSKTPNQGDQSELAIEMMICRIIKGSLVLFQPGPTNIGITVGILGEFVAMLNVPADIEDFPRYEDEHDLGHICVISKKVLHRSSYRLLLQKIMPYLQKMEEAPKDEE